MDQSGTLFDRSCIVSVRSSENRFHSLEVHPAIAKSAEPCSWKSKGVDCQSSELDCKSFELDAHNLNVNASIVFHLLALCCLMYTFYSAEAVLGTTEAVSSELLAEAV